MILKEVNRYSYLLSFFYFYFCNLRNSLNPFSFILEAEGTTTAEVVTAGMGEAIAQGEEATATVVEAGREEAATEGVEEDTERKEEGMVEKVGEEGEVEGTGVKDTNF